MTQIAESNRADYQLYVSSAAEYDRVRFKGLAGNWGHRRQLHIIQSLCDDWQGKRVLEIGCGTGRITEMLVRWGAKVTATDITAEMLDVARARCQSYDRSQMPELRTMSVFAIDVDLEPYDYVIMINVLGRLTNPDLAIQEIARRLSPETRLVFSFPCLTSVLLPFGLLVNARNKSLSRDVTSRWYRPETIAGYCSAAGLEVTRFLGNHYVPVPRVLSLTLPFFWICERMLAQRFPAYCPSVLVECRRPGPGGRVVPRAEALRVTP